MTRLPTYGYFLLIAAVFAFVFYFVTRSKERAKMNWPTAPGKVLDSTILRTTKAYLRTPTVSLSAKDDQYYQDVKVWALRAEYEYEVGGQVYKATRATATDHVDAISDYPDGPSPQMTQWKDELSKGTKVSVHYDPTEPSESYIIYTESAALSTVMKTGIVLLLLAIALVAAPRIFSK